MRAATAAAGMDLIALISEPALSCVVELALVAVELSDLSPELLVLSFTFSFTFTS